MMNRKTWFFNLVALFFIQLILVLPLNAGDYDVRDISLTPGAEASKLNFAWITNNLGTGKCVVQIAKKSTGFTESDLFYGKKAYAEEAGYYYCEVEVSNLKSQIDYVYRLGDNDDNWTDPYDYFTRNTNKYGFIYLADSQLGASKPPKGGLEKDVEGWINTLNLIKDKFPETAFILSGGDQIEHPGNEDEWTGFFSPPELKSIPLAPTPASHDELGTGRGGAPSSNGFDYHYNLPNESEHFKVYADVNNCPPPGAPGPPGPPCTPDYQWSELAAGDYYFTYGNVLYIIINADQQLAGYPNSPPGEPCDPDATMDCSEHGKFMKEAVAANPNVNWKIVMWHYSIYSAGMHSTDCPILALREAMYPIIDDLDIDIVFMGHDHHFSRSYQMLGNEPQKKQSVGQKGEVINPTGTLYFTGNSSSGSKYYRTHKDVKTFNYPSIYNQLEVPSFSYVTVDAESLSISTFRTDTMQEFDTYTIKKMAKKNK